VIGAAAYTSQSYKQGKDPGYFAPAAEFFFADEKAIIEDPKKVIAAVHAIVAMQGEYIAQEALKKWPK
jgi:hypothetical protein